MRRFDTIARLETQAIDANLPEVEVIGMPAEKYSESSREEVQKGARVVFDNLQLI